VLSYKKALWLGLEHLKEKPFISTNLCIRIVQCIKQNTASIRLTPGTTLSNTKGEVIYTPPTGEAVIREKLANLEKFINGAYSGLFRNRNVICLSSLVLAQTYNSNHTKPTR